jgi:hypothetical protein
MRTDMWEILVPASGNNKQEFTYEHHKAWDAYVKNLTGGVTIMKTAKGQWVSQEGELYIDRMIPCRIFCSDDEILQIVRFTMTHYNQKAIAIAKLSDESYIIHEDNIPDKLK